MSVALAVVMRSTRTRKKYIKEFRGDTKGQMIADVWVMAQNYSRDTAFATFSMTVRESLGDDAELLQNQMHG
jgi:hypothetical protein